MYIHTQYTCIFDVYIYASMHTCQHIKYNVYTLCMYTIVYMYIYIFVLVHTVCVQVSMYICIYTQNIYMYSYMFIETHDLILTPYQDPHIQPLWDTPRSWLRWPRWRMRGVAPWPAATASPDLCPRHLAMWRCGASQATVNGYTIRFIYIYTYYIYTIYTIYMYTHLDVHFS